MQGDEGTCYESINGGNHARWWKQNGTAADTNAIFMAASVEMNAQANHMIVDNGEYDRICRYRVGGEVNYEEKEKDLAGKEVHSSFEDRATVRR